MSDQLTPCQHRGRTLSASAFCHHPATPAVVQHNFCSGCQFAPMPVSLDCVHRQAQVASLISPCGETHTRPIFGCALHGSCVTRTRDRDRAPALPACSRCADRQPSGSQPVEGCHRRTNLRREISLLVDSDHRRDLAQQTITIIMTAFRRPQKVINQIASIRRFYPDVPIIVGDNGDDPPNLSQFEHVTLLQLPFDCGLSASRNELTGRVTTPFTMLVDDDYLWTEFTRLEDLLDVLQHDPAIGVVGGWWYDQQHNRTRHISWANRFEVSGDTLALKNDHPTPTVTPGNVPYWRADTVHNFALYRTEVLQAHQWEERLKLQEHWEYFYRLKQAGIGVAFTPAVSVIHDRLPRLPEYNEFRNRFQEFSELALALHGFTHLETVPFDDNTHQSRRPNIVVLTPMNSGSSILTRMLGALGWNLGEADADTWAEHTTIREEINIPLKEGQPFNVDLAKQCLDQLDQPWAIKEPRFLDTWQTWLKLWEPYAPTLLYIRRDPQQLQRSMDRRTLGVQAEERLQRCQQIVEHWPWASLTLDFEDLCHALSLFDATRINAGLPGDGHATTH